MDTESGKKKDLKSGDSIPKPDGVDFNQPQEFVGQTLDGRFLIEKNLTETGADAGGIGVVYLAKDLKLLGKQVVVKILQEAALRHGDIVRKFMHEKEALIRLDHPNIVRILDYGTLSNGNPFMVMSYIKGHSLRKPIAASGAQPFNFIAHVILSVTDALSAAHSEKILHRDIKPENIMLTPQDDAPDQVQLIDFGIARVGESKLAPGTEFSRAIGSVLYIAPEQLIGDLDLTPAADIYSVAIMAYEMLTGELPFKPKAIAEMYQLEKDGLKVPPSELRRDLPREAERILMSALEFDPAKRPQNARSFGKYFAAELMASEATDRFFSSIKTEYKKIPPEALSDPALLATVISGDFGDTSDFETSVRIPPGDDKPAPSNLRTMWFVIAGLLLVLIAIPAVWLATRSSSVETPSPANAAATASDRKLSYFLKVQKMRDGKPFGEPFKSSGQEVYESGYRFSFNMQPESDGHIYIYNEGKDSKGETGYYLIFPTLSVNNNSSKIAAGQLVETAQNGFGGGVGTEIMWLIWSSKQHEGLEAIWQAVPDKRQPVSDPTQVELLRSFQKAYEASKPTATKDTPNQRTIVQATGDLIVHRFELEHR